MAAADEHDLALEDWVLGVLGDLDARGRDLGLAARGFSVASIAHEAQLDERVTAVVLDRLVRDERVMREDGVEPAFALDARRAAPAARGGQTPPAVDHQRFGFSRTLRPERGAQTKRCAFDPEFSRADRGPHCDGSGWIMDPVTRLATECRCRSHTIATARRRLVGGTPPSNSELALDSHVRSLDAEMHPAVRTLVNGWADDPLPRLARGDGLWLSVAPWDEVAAPAPLDEGPLPPRTPEEFEAAAARAADSMARPVDAAAAPDDSPLADGGLTDADMRKMQVTAAGYAASRMTMAVHYAGRVSAFYTLASLHRTLGYLSRTGGYRPRLQALGECDLLTIVGIDQRVFRYASAGMRDWLREQLELIARRRYDHGKSTILVSTGWPLEELAAALGEETFHRLSCAAGTPLLASLPPSRSGRPAHQGAARA